MSHYFRDQGRQLLAKGYRIVPIAPGAKYPQGVEAWETVLMGPGDLGRFPHHGVGVVTGVGVAPIVGVDIDSEDETLAIRFTEWCLKNLGTAPIRVGRAPRRLLVYRANEAGIPKGTSPYFLDLFGGKSRLEILGSGQQFVAYHTHPDTRKPYQWVGAEPELTETRASDLTCVNVDQLVAAMEAFNRLAAELGLDRSGGGKGLLPKVPTERTPRSDEDFFGRVNDAAMSNLPAWVPTLFPCARPYQEGFRVRQSDLGRGDLEEDLSIQPEGIKDWGVHDMGDARNGGRTPIDLVVEWGHLTMDDLAMVGPSAAFEAAKWLCEQLSTPPEALGFGLRRKREKAVAQDAQRSALAAIQQRVTEAEDMIAIQADVLPEIQSLLLEFPNLEGSAFALVAAKAKAVGTPITKGEFHRLVKPASTPAVKRPKPLTEFGNADRMIEMYGRSLMYCPDIERWFIWNGNNWRPSLGGRSEIEHLAKETIRKLVEEVDDHPEPGEFFQFCALSQRAAMVHNMVTLAESDPAVVVPASDIDKDPFLLGVKNGVVDLRTGALLPPDPNLHITMTCACEYDPSARAHMFEKTLADVFFDDAEMVEFVMRAFGYALMGNPTEDIMFIAFGNGANGKSTIFNTVRKVFGGYARSADPTSFIADGNSGGAGSAREDIVRLRGARFVYVNEPDENGELREGVVKGMTGGDSITARGVYAKNSVEIQPSWVVFMPTNHKPIIKGNDNGIWRRMGLIPFERNFETDRAVVKDAKREEKLLSEMPGILALLVKAALRYQQYGLSMPPKVLAARDAYRSQMDLLAEWLDECCDIGPNHVSPSADLWTSWKEFAERRGLLNYIRSSTALGRRLDVRFPMKKGTNGARLRIGIQLKSSF